MEATKEVVIGNSRYQISRIDAETGSFILYQILESLRKLMKEDGEQDQQTAQKQEETKTSEEISQATKGMIQVMLTNLDRQMFGRIQKDALRVCSQFSAVGENETLLPVLMVDGRVAIPTLRTDIQTLMTLTQESLHFNLLPFFSNGGFKAIMS